MMANGDAVNADISSGSSSNLGSMRERLFDSQDYPYPPQNPFESATSPGNYYPYHSGYEL